MNALDFLKSENQSSKISAKSFLSGEVEVQPELTQPKKEFVQPSSSNPNLEALGKTLYNLPRNLVEVSDSIVSGATLGLSERAAQAGTWASKKLFGEIPGRQEQLQEADKDYEPTNKYVKGAAEFAGAVAPISVASKFLATPIKVAVSGIGKSKYIPPLANLIGWGVAGSAYDTTANLIKEGELPTAKEVAESGAMWMGFEGVLSAAGWTGKLALGVRRFAKDAGITSKEALNVILGEAKKTNAPIAKFASDWTKYQSQLKKMEGTPRGEELNLKINQAAEDFVNDVYVKANKVGKQGTYPDLIDSIIQKDKDIIASKKGTPLLKPDTTPVKSRIPEPLKGVQGEGDARPLWEIKQEVDSIERERYIDAIIENYKANQLLAEKGFKKAQRDLEKTRELFDLASKEKEKISKSRAEDIKVDEEFVPENIPMSEQSLRPDQKAKLSERLRPEEPVPSNELSAIEGADRRKIPVEDVKADAQRRDEISKFLNSNLPKDKSLVPESSLETSTSVPLADAQKAPGQVPVSTEKPTSLTESTVGKQASSVASTSTISAEKGLGQAEIKTTEELLGETSKESKLAIRAEADTIEKKLTEDFGDLAEYKTTPNFMKDQAERAAQILNADYESAKLMAMGEIKPPEGVREATMFEAVKVRALAEGDTDTLYKLATESTVPTRLSEYGQAIKAADSRIMDDPVKAMQEIGKIRAENIKKRTGKAPNAKELSIEVERLSKELETTRIAFEERLANLETKKAETAIDNIIKPKATTKPEVKYGSTNKIVTTERYEKIRAELRKELGGTKLSAGIDPMLIEKMGEIGVYHFEAGATAFKNWSVKMIADLGAWVKPHLKEIWDGSKGKVKAITIETLSGKITKSIEDGQDLSEVGGLVQKIAKHFVEQGVTERSTLIKEVHSVLKEIMPGITERETMDAISGYGKYKLLSKDEVSTQLRDLKGQMQQVAKLEDLQKKQPPLKTGSERRTPSNEERRLIKLVEDAKKKYGIQVVDKATQLKSSLDAIKTRLTNQITDLESQIASKEKIVKGKAVVTYDAEATALKTKRDALKTTFDEIFGKNQMSEAQKINMAIKSVETSIAEYTRKIATKDLTPLTKKTKLSSERLDALRLEREGLKDQLQTLRDIANPKRTPEQIATQSLKTRLKNETQKYSDKLKNLDFEPKEKRITALDAEAKQLKSKHEIARENYKVATEAAGIVTKEEADNIVRLSSEVANYKKNFNDSAGEWTSPQDKGLYGAAKVVYVNYVNGLKDPTVSIKTAIKNRLGEAKITWKSNKAKAVFDLSKDTLKTVADNSVSMVATLDNSFIGRQGLFTLGTHPSKWWPGAKNSFIDFAKTIGGKNTRNALMADIYSRPRYLNGEYQKAGLVSTVEEQYPTSMPERIPGIGRAFKASQEAFVGSGLRMRLGVYDMLADKAAKNGVDVKNVLSKDLGTMINALTMRGKWGERGVPKVIRLVMWAPDMLKGQLDVLTAHYLGAGLETAFVRKEAAKNILKLVSEAATIMLVANAIKPGSAETNPTSSDFGKIKIGDTRFNYTGGANALIILAARLRPDFMGGGEYKSVTTGKMIKYEPGFGKRSRFDAVIDFLANKTNPPASMVRDWLRGRTFDNKDFTAKGAAYRAFTPITVQQAIQLKDNASADRVAGVLADAIGINATSFEDKKHRNNKFR